MHPLFLSSYIAFSQCGLYSYTVLKVDFVPKGIIVTHDQFGGVVPDHVFRFDQTEIFVFTQWFDLHD